MKYATENTSVVAVRYFLGRDDMTAKDMGLLCETYANVAPSGVGNFAGYRLTDKEYHYYSEVECTPGDLVFVRSSYNGENKISLAMISRVLDEQETVHATRTVIAKVDFSSSLEERRRENRLKQVRDQLGRSLLAVVSDEQLIEFASCLPMDNAPVDKYRHELRTLLED